MPEEDFTIGMAVKGEEDVQAALQRVEATADEFSKQAEGEISEFGQKAAEHFENSGTASGMLDQKIQNSTEGFQDAFQAGAMMASDEMGEMQKSISEAGNVYDDEGKRMGAQLGALTQKTSDAAETAGQGFESLQGKFSQAAWNITWMALSLIGVLWNLSQVGNYLQEPIDRINKVLGDTETFVSDFATSVALLSMRGWGAESAVSMLGESLGLTGDEAENTGSVIGGMVDTSLEFRTVMQSLQNVIRALAVSVFRGFMVGLQKAGIGMDDIADKVASLVPLIADLGQGFAEGIIFFVEALESIDWQGAINPLIDSFIQGLQMIWKYWHWFLSSLGYITHFLSIITGGLIPSLRGMGSAFGEMQPQVEESASSAQKMGQMLGQLFGIAKMFTPMLSMMMGSISALVSPIVGVATALAGLRGLMWTVQQAQMAINLAVSVGKTVISAYKGVVDTVAAAIQFLRTHTLMQTAAMIKQKAAYAASAVGAKLYAAAQWVANNALYAFPLFAIIGGLAVLATQWDTVAGAIGWVWKQIKKLIRWIQDLFSPLDAVSDMLGGVSDSITGVFGGSPGGQLEDSIKHAVSTAKKGRKQLNREFSEIRTPQLTQTAGRSIGARRNQPTPGAGGGSGGERNIRVNNTINIKTGPVTGDADIREIADEVDRRLEEKYNYERRVRV